MIKFVVFVVVTLFKWFVAWLVIGVLITVALDYECLKAMYLLNDIPITCQGDTIRAGTWYWLITVGIVTGIVWGISIAFVWLINLESTLLQVIFGALFLAIFAGVFGFALSFFAGLYLRKEHPELLTAEERGEIDSDDEEEYEETPRRSKSKGFLKGFADSFNEDNSSSQSSSQSAPAREPYRVPKQKTQTYAPPQKPEKYFVQVLKPGQYKYQNLTGGDSNLINATRRMEQHMDARHGTDSKNNASKAKYRIVNQDGKVQ